MPTPARRLRHTAVVAGLAVGALSAGACFRGDDTIGAVCEQSSDCGDGQSCSGGVCGRCGDGNIDAGEICLEKVSEELIGGGAVVMLHTDLDQDGDVDILTVVNTACGPLGMNGTCWSLTILLAEGDGNYQVGNAIEELPGEVVDLVVGDFDGDQVIDSVVAFAEQTNLLVSLQTGVADESVTVPIAVPTPVASLAVGDFDGDGADEVAAASASTTDIYIGSSASGMPGVTSTLTGGGASQLLPVVDIDGDGHLDLIALSNFPRSAQVFRGDGAGGFAAPQVLPVPQSTTDGIVYDGALGDLDGDGALDLVVVDPGGPNFYVALNAGDGSLGELKPYQAVGYPTGLALSDFDADGDLDLVLSDAGDDKLRLHRGDRGDFLEPIEIVTSFAPFSILSTDLDGNGADDLAISNLTGTIAIVLSKN